jgi:hypothetical protein
MKKALSLALITLLWACSTPLDLSREDTVLPLSPDVTDGFLPNGMRYVLTDQRQPRR